MLERIRQLIIEIQLRIRHLRERKRERESLGEVAKSV